SGAAPSARGGGPRGDPLLSVERSGPASAAARHLHTALPVRPAMTPARLVTLLACALVAAGTARAQDSQFGIVGLGTPGRWESGRARTGAGAFAAFDPASTVTETALAEIGLHLLAGSTRMTATRSFDDSTVYFTVQQAGTVRYAGLGVSGSVLLALTPTVSLAGFARRDGHLSAYVADTLVTRSDLPATVGG